MIEETKSMYTHYITQGNGPPVVMIHGVGASARDWDGLLTELSSAGFRAYAPDLLGHGQSAKPGDLRNYNAETIYAHFETWISNLDLPALPVLVGHSLGGFISLAFALHHPGQVQGLILVNPFFTPAQLTVQLRLICRYPQWGEKALRAAPLWLIRLTQGLEPYDARFCSRTTSLRTAKDYKQASPYIAYIPASLPDLTSRLRHITVPVLVIWGEKDVTLNPRFFPNLVQHLPNAKGAVIRGRGHKPHLSRPKETHWLILEFISSLHGIQYEIVLPDQPAHYQTKLTNSER